VSHLFDPLQAANRKRLPLDTFDSINACAFVQRSLIVPDE
jgi:hypothetical protein